MLNPHDEEIIVRMTGSSTSLPKEFLDEYIIRLKMLHLNGASGGIGPIAMLALLREFGIGIAENVPTFDVEDWNQVEMSTRITYYKRPGVYMGVIGGGQISIRLDGEQALREVPGREVRLAAKIVEGIDDAEFEQEPKSPKQEEFEASQDNNGRVPKDPLLDRFNSMESGQSIGVKRGRRVIEAEFVDIQGDDKVVVLIDGKKKTVQANSVLINQEAS